jgi:general secretion pathway protein E/type IV pilus assembly protein PilB
MVGEIRDLETAEIATKAALTGHLVFSTLHTNDACGAVTRLVDLGVKSFLVATSLRAVVAQRLVRHVCRACSQPHVPTEFEKGVLMAAGSDTSFTGLRKGRGCPVCHGTGYKGRLGLFEIFVVDDALRRMIYEGASLVQLRAEAHRQGMRSLRGDGVRKVLAGLTTVDEVLSTTLGDAN